MYIPSTISGGCVWNDFNKAVHNCECYVRPTIVSPHSHRLWRRVSLCSRSWVFRTPRMPCPRTATSMTWYWSSSPRVRRVSCCSTSGACVWWHHTVSSRYPPGHWNTWQCPIVPPCRTTAWRWFSPRFESFLFSCFWNFFLFEQWGHSLVDVDLSFNKSDSCVNACVRAICEVDSEEPPLRAIQLRGSAVSFEMVQRLVTRCGRLESIDLQSCRSLPRGIKREFKGEDFKQFRTDLLNGKIN